MSVLARTLILTASSLLSPIGASAADFHVTTLLDSEDASPGDGSCATADGECTLRAAVTEASLSANATIHLLDGLHRVDLGPLAPNNQATFQGAGRDRSVIDGGDQAFVLDGPGGFHLRGLEVRGGSDTAVRTDFDVSVSDCRITDARIGVQGWWVSLVDSEIIGCTGIAVLASNASLLRSRIEGNDAGVDAMSCTIQDSDIIANLGFGVNAGPGLRLERSRIQGNSSTGILGNESVELEDSIVTDNGGGLSGGVHGDGTVSLLRCEVSGNGGAFDVFGRAGLTIVDSHAGKASDGFGFGSSPSTVVENSTVGTLVGGHVRATHATLINVEGDSARLWNSVAVNCPVLLSSLTGTGSWTPLGCTVDGDDNLEGADPLLGPLEDGGDGISSRAPLPGSPLVDAASPAIVVDFDQHGRMRPLDFDGDGSDPRSG